MSFKELFSLKGNLLHGIQKEGRSAITDESCCTTVLCEFPGNIHPFLSTLAASGKRFQALFERGCPRLRLASSSLVPRT